MKVQDCHIECSDKWNKGVRKGLIISSEEFSFEIHGPFGQGYNIRVKKMYPNLFEKLFSKAKLKYHWQDGPGTSVRTPISKYGMSEIAIVKGGMKVLEMDEEGNFQAISDKYAMALFDQNHYFWKKNRAI